MSVNITIKHALKKFGDNVIIPDLSLKIKGGEFFTILGPSGCGKTTLLRMIAGFNTIEGGEFWFDDRLINDLNPAKRNIGMVFQNYAIFPHLTVRRNVEFGLTNNREYSKQRIRKQAQRFLDLVHISDLAERMPSSLSGGQQQRVALARALCVEPDVLLMDEPLSNLDAKLRLEMRKVIKDIQRAVNITTVYVTHDQEEAMAISDRIAVMNKGVVQQIGAPKNIYQRPTNIFVATFIGRSNVVEGELLIKEDESFVRIGDYQTPISGIKKEFKNPRKIKLSIRPEELFMTRNAGRGIKAIIDDSVFLGQNTYYFMHLPSGQRIECIQMSTIDSIISPGTDVLLNIDTMKVNLFTSEGTQNILEGVADDGVANSTDRVVKDDSNDRVAI